MIGKLRHRATGLLFLLSLFYIFTTSSCNRVNSKDNNTPSFKNVLGMQYVEVDRYFTNGLSFNQQGYELEPSWKMYLLSDDSLMIYHPQAKVYFHYPMYHDHDSVFNIARHWMRVKMITKDSIIFQLLSVEEKKIDRDFSNAFMKFYSYEYLTKRRINPEKLRLPSSNDTLFIKGKSEKANRNPGNRDSSFAARTPVVLSGNASEISVEKIKVELDPHDLFHVSPADEYLYPEYKIAIQNAYKDFNYTFSVLVDDKGKMRLGKFIVSPEFAESRKRVLQGIIDVYLQRFLTVTPGTTLGIRHTSEITLHVQGRK